jgi:hypothetical protein
LKKSFERGFSYLLGIRDNLDGSRLFKTAENRFGHGNTDVCPSDILCSISGCDAATYILRRVSMDGNNELYKLVSMAYVHGMMNGEVEDMGLEEQDITLC